MGKLELREGNIGNCWKCNKQIFGRMTKGSENHPPKLQWQEAIEGVNPPAYQSHYIFNKATQEISCRGQPKTEQSTQEANPQVTTPEQSVLDKKIFDAMEKEGYERAILKIARLKGVERACKDYGITQGATVGMLYNSIDREASD